MRAINISLNDFLLFMNDQDTPKQNNPIIKNEFSFKLKSLMFLNKKQYENSKIAIIIGIILEVINKKIRLYFVELNKYFIPTKVLSAKTDDICKG